MKTKKSTFNSIAFNGTAVVFACLIGITPNAQAQGTWLGSATDHNESNTANWFGGIRPANWTMVTFDANVVDGLFNVDTYPYFVSGLTLASSLTKDITIGGSTLFTGDANIDMSAAGANLTVNANLAMYGAVSIWDVGSGRTLTLNGNVKDWDHKFIKNGLGTAVLAGANSNTGGTSINAGTLVVSNADSLGIGNVVINNGGTLYVNQQWVLHGVNPYTNLEGTTPGVTNVTVNAGGQLALDPINGFANGVMNLYLNGGSVTGGNSDVSYGALYLYNGNEQITAGGITNSSISGNLGITGNNNTITVDSGSSLNITGVLKDGQWGGGGFIKAGAGTLMMSSSNTYSGATLIQNGTLLVNNATGSGMGPGNVTVQSGATLGGTGSISGNITVQSGGMLGGTGSISGNVALQSGALFSGTGVISGNVTFDSGAKALFVTNSTLNITGTLTLNDTVVQLPVALPIGFHTLATCTGPINGAFASTPIFDRGSMGYDGKIYVEGNQVILKVFLRGTVMRFR